MSLGGVYCRWENSNTHQWVGPRGRVLQLTSPTAMSWHTWRCIAQVGRRARAKMWEFEVLMRDSGMRCFCGIFKQKAGLLVRLTDVEIPILIICGTAALINSHFHSLACNSVFTFQRLCTVMFSSRYTRSPFVMLSAVLLIVLTATHRKVEGRIPEEFISAGTKGNRVTVTMLLAILVYTYHASHHLTLNHPFSHTNSCLHSFFLLLYVFVII